ncbi:MAG: uncharacterized protein A8A55_0077 [Amphiamblys sp. WSBS2006]|nr:MAG: uncharacterized protein A8A55_0077 [Amphiamblys sp. WSBS2006]
MFLALFLQAVVCVVHRECSEENEVALTFDCVSGRYLSTVLQILEDHDARGLIYVSPDILHDEILCEKIQRAVSMGCTIGLYFIPPEGKSIDETSIGELADEVRKGLNTIPSVSGEDVKHVRVAGNNVSKSARRMFGSLGLVVTKAGLHIRDEGDSFVSVLSSFEAGLEGGRKFIHGQSVESFHSSSSLGEMIASIRKGGMEIVDIQRCIPKTSKR